MPVLRAQREEAQSRRVARRIVAASLAAVGLTWFLVVGSVLLIAASYTAGTEVEKVHPLLLWLVLAGAVLAAVLAPWRARSRAGRDVARRLGAVPLEPTDRAHRQLQRRVQEMALAAGIPAPRVWLRPGWTPNVSAWSDAHGDHLAFTWGTLGLPQPELATLAAHGCARLRLPAGRDAARTDETAGTVLCWIEPKWGGHREAGWFRTLLAVLFALAFSLVVMFITYLARVAARQVRVARRDRAQAADALAAGLTRDPDAFEALMRRVEGMEVEGGDHPELVAATSFVPPAGTLDADARPASLTARTVDARRGWVLA